MKQLGIFSYFQSCFQGGTIVKQSIFQCPVSGGGFGNDLSGTKSVNAPGDIQNPAEGINAAAGKTGILPDGVVVELDICF